MLSNPTRETRVREFWQADICAGNAPRITMAEETWEGRGRDESYLNLLDVVGSSDATFARLTSRARNGKVRWTLFGERPLVSVLSLCFSLASKDRLTRQSSRDF